MSAKTKSLPRASIASIRIGFDAYDAVLEELADAYEDVPYAAAPICMQIIGPPRVSKSSAVREFEASFPLVRTAGGITKSVVYVGVPSDGTLKSVMQNALRSLNDPNYHRGTRDQLTYRLKHLLAQVGCKMLILDEVQHLCDKGQKKLLDTASDWLKTLVEDKEFALVLVGLPESRSVVVSNPQLVDRFRAPILIKPFNWNNPNERTQFRRVIRAFCDELTPYELPSLAEDIDLSFRCYLACAGKIGLLTLILDEAMRRAYKYQSRTVRMEELQSAYEKVIYFSDGFPINSGPFLGNLQAKASTSVDLVDQVLSASVNIYNDQPDKAHMGTLERPGSTVSTASRKTKKSLRLEIGRVL